MVKIDEKVELMAPAGSFESLHAAIKAGADSIYFGIKGLNMRSLGAKNFEIGDLKDIAKLCKEKGIRSYITLNTVMYDEDHDKMSLIADSAKDAGIDAAICMDMAAVLYCNKIGLEVHTSTQTNVSNTEAVKFFSRYADMIVLARELSLEQIKKICENIKVHDIRGPKGDLVKIEIFVHGALCVAISGKCYMSLASFNKSANRGECLQVCRRKYRVLDDETGNELVIDNEYVMSPKDLCTLPYLDKIICSGVSVFKIEGRGRSPDYVYTTVKAYREAIDSIYEGTFSKEKIDIWMEKLRSVFNRGFWEGGYYLGIKMGEWAGTYGSQSKKNKISIGVARNFYSQKGIADFEIQADTISVGDDLIITGPTTGYIELKVQSLHTKDGDVKTAEKGTLVSFPVPQRVRNNDKLFKIVDV